MVTFTGFINCCGAGIIYGFGNTPEHKKHTEEQFQGMFGDAPKINIQYLKNVGFVHATLNDNQLPLNEELLLRYGFKRVSSGINNIHRSKIHHFIRVGVPIKEPKVIKVRKLTKRRFGSEPSKPKSIANTL